MGENISLKALLIARDKILELMTPDLSPKETVAYSRAATIVNDLFMAAPSPSLGEPMVELEVRNGIVSLKHTLAPTEQFYDGMKLYASPTAAQEQKPDCKCETFRAYGACGHVCAQPTALKDLYALAHRWIDVGDTMMDLRDPVQKACAETARHNSQELLTALALFASPVPASGWVKCSERMPETYKRVLMRLASGIISTGHLGSGSEGWRPDADNHNTDVGVTEWMPLPAVAVGETK